MYSFHKFLEELYLNTKIPFKVTLDDKEFILSEFDNSDTVSLDFEVNDKKGKIVTQKEYESCTSLLRYLIENKIKEVSSNKEKLIKKALNGVVIDKNIIDKELYFLKDEFFIINVYLASHIQEGLELINECYGNKNIVSVLRNDSIVIIGTLEDIEEHLNSIKDSIASNLYTKCYISYMKLNNINEIKEAYEINMSKINLAIKYDLDEIVYGDRDLLFENLVDSIDEDLKNKMYEDFGLGFSKLDREMIKTIETFFKCGLNISDASKELYVHRNTLIYRLDKIQKCTSYDIRNFNEAVIFKIAFLIWRGKEISK
ncbi:PucR family transcriptional regulator [Clostridium sp. LIBA-8841]|uniref:PucR family transcriptional regulator n=1 Tax=Clostridium sp. LIBA-8841 TaxID=2987530 RepID=UPI002AC5F20A|nr:helix-turn-helix domain-containing protein [Clostridium sp. LIBA-8841]MDZ5255004.1 helix-turn-helix domain-containing protein [Clostridium sp. LIBA-8841]